MQSLKVFLAAALVAACGAARADLSFGPGLPWLAGCGSMTTVNTTPHWLWVTIYDLARTQHLDYGWVEPRGYRDWRAGNYSCAGIYYVRGKVKNVTQGGPAGGNNIFDTTVQVKGGGSNHTVYLESDVYEVRSATPGHSNYVAAHNKSFFWSVGSRADTAHNPPQGTVDEPVMKITNATPLALLVKQEYPPPPPSAWGSAWEDYRRYQARPPECIRPGGEWTNAFYSAADYEFQISPVERCEAVPAAPIFHWPVTIGWGANNFTWRGVLRSAGATGGTPTQIDIRNRMPHPVQFIVEGAPGPAPCLAPRQQDGSEVVLAKLPVGMRKVTPTYRPRCGDASPGLAFPSEAISVPTTNQTNFWEFQYALEKK